MPDEKEKAFDPQTEKEQAIHMPDLEDKLQEEYSKLPEEPKDRKPGPSVQDQLKELCNCGPDQKLVQFQDKNKEFVVECLECGGQLKFPEQVSGVAMKNEDKSDLTGK